MRGGNVSLASKFLKERPKNQFESEIATWVNKHLALELYFTVLGQSIMAEAMETSCSD